MILKKNSEVALMNKRNQPSLIGRIMRFSGQKKSLYTLSVILAVLGVAEQGTHDELMKQNGIYRRFIDARVEAVSWKIS